MDYAYYVRGVANMEQNYDGLIRYTSLKQAHRDVSYLKVAYQNFVDLFVVTLQALMRCRCRTAHEVYQQ